MSTATARFPLQPRVLTVALLVLCLALSACGRRGPLEPPPEADPQDVRLPTERPTPPPEGQRPERPFILDGLLM